MRSSCIFWATLLLISESSDAQNIGINTDGSSPETGIMLDIKGTNLKSTTLPVQTLLQLKSFDANTDALKLRYGFKTDATPANRYGFIDFVDLSGGTPTYRNLSLQPLGGSVSIGTVTPMAKLDIVGNTLRLGPQSYDANYPYPNSSYLVLDKTASNEDASIVFRESGNARAEIGIVTDDHIHFKTVTGTFPTETFTDRFMIQASGEVWSVGKYGVGTIPVEFFHIANSVSASRLIALIENTNTGAGTSRSSTVQFKSNLTDWSVGTDLGLNSGNNFYISDNAASTRFFIDGNGNTGIGTTGPTEFFHIAKSVSASRLIAKIENTNAGGGSSRSASIQLRSSGVDWSIGTDFGLNSGNNFYIADNAVSSRLMIDGNGNVGIGVGVATSINTKLDVDGALALRTGSTVNLTADNQIVTVGNRSYLRLSSNNATGSNRTIVLTGGFQAGQILIIEFTGTNQAELLDNGALNGGGNQRLNGNLTLTQYDTITLIWNATDWNEMSRSAN